MSETTAWLTAFGWGRRFLSGIRLLFCSRDLIDWGVRRGVGALPNVRFRQGVAVTGLLADGGGRTVEGVQLGTSHGEKPAADLVAVTDGRSSRLPGWLVALGHAAPAQTVVKLFLGYASRLYRPPRGFRPGWKHLYVQPAPPGETRGGSVFAIEGGALAGDAGGRRRRLPAH